MDMKIDSMSTETIEEYLKERKKKEDITYERLVRGGWEEISKEEFEEWELMPSVNLNNCNTQDYYKVFQWVDSNSTIEVLKVRRNGELIKWDEVL